jgi:hypothetical protein
MPVQKFKSFDAARRALWISPDDPRLAQRIASLWDCSRELSGYTPPLGVQKFRSIEEANLERDERRRKRMVERAQQLGFL